MMKKIATHTIQSVGCFIVLLLSSLIVRAQELQQGSFESLLDCRVVSVQFEFSNTTVEGLPLSDFIQNQSFIEGKDYSNYFTKAKQEIIGEFIEEFNDTDCPILLSVAASPYGINLVVNVHEISRKGNEVKCSYEFSKQGDSMIMCGIDMNTQDGRIGSFTNLMGDAFEKAGKDLGKYIKKKLKQVSQKRR